MICPTCGTENPSRRKKCKFCGSPLVNEASVFSVESIPASSYAAGVQGTEQVQSNSGIPGLSLDAGETIIREYHPSEEYISKRVKIAVVTSLIAAVAFVALFIPLLLIGSGAIQILPLALFLYLIYVEAPLTSSAISMRRLKAVRYWITNRRVIITDARKVSRLHEFPLSSVEKAIVSSRPRNSEYPTVIFVLKRSFGATSQNGMPASTYPMGSDPSEGGYKWSGPAYIRYRRITPLSSYRLRSFFWIKRDDAEGIQQLIENLKNGNVSTPVSNIQKLN